MVASAASSSGDCRDSHTAPFRRLAARAVQNLRLTRSARTLGCVRNSVFGSMNSLSQIAILSRSGKLVWFLACPSNGWLSEQHKLGALCRTYTNLVMVRMRDLPQIKLLNWPSSLSTTNFADQEADRLSLGPFTQDGFDRLGEFLASEIARRAAGQDLARASSATSGSSELADYLAGLQVRVELVVADPQSTRTCRPHPPNRRVIFADRRATQHIRSRGRCSVGIR